MSLFLYRIITTCLSRLWLSDLGMYSRLNAAVEVVAQGIVVSSFVSDRNCTFEMLALEEVFGS